MTILVEDISEFPGPGMDYPSAFTFSPDGRYLTYLKIDSSTMERSLYLTESRNFNEKLLVSSAREVTREESLEEELRKQRLRQMSGGISQYFWTSDNKIVFKMDGDIFVLDNLDSTPRLLVDASEFSAMDPKVSPNGKNLAFVSLGEIYIVRLEGGHPVKLTDGKAGTTRGLAEYIAQEEMGRSSGYWWSPDSKSIAFIEVDETNIPEFILTNLGDELVPNEAYRYPFAGCDNADVRLGITDLHGNMSWADTSNYEYIARVNWTKKGSLVVQCQTRDQTRLDLLKFDSSLNGSTIILSEQSDVWVNLHDMFRALDDEEFIWASERTGYRHIYHYDCDGNQKRQITDGKWQVDNLVAVDQEKKLIYFTSSADSSLESNFYRINFDGSDFQRLSTIPGIHTVVCDVQSNLYVDTIHSASLTPVVHLSKISDDQNISIIHNTLDTRVEKFNLRPPEFVKIASKNDDQLNGAIFFPDESFGEGPHPTILYVYGGPHAQLVTNSWNLTASLRIQYFREQGYLVFVLDNRGSARQGLLFESHIKNRMGSVEIEDQLSGIEWLIKKGYSDQSKIGVYGWSYGGYMALMCLAQVPEVFKVAVAGAPVTSWDGYDTHYTERYMGTPVSNPDGYVNSSVMEYASNIRGELMLIHGLIDENVHFRHSARLINALISFNKKYDLVLFPKERHMPRRQSDRTYLETRLTEFFKKYL